MREITGRVGGATLVRDLNLAVDGASLTGRVGGQFQGKDLALSAHGVPPAVLVVAALAAYRALEDSRKDSSNHSGGP
ncbi:MAG TPA: hypothetical protein VNT60_05055 [Deinococcales bacterium]|nr:hypothetical protein [Deinococcales bacterium]